MAGDWGSANQAQREANEEANRCGGRLRGLYHTLREDLIEVIYDHGKIVVQVHGE